MNRATVSILHSVLPFLLMLQLCLPFLHICLEGRCGTDPQRSALHGENPGGAGLHGQHAQHLHDEHSVPCLESADPTCRDLHFTLDNQTPFQPAPRSPLVQPAPLLAAFGPRGLWCVFASPSGFRPAANPASSPTPQDRPGTVLRI